MGGMPGGMGGMGGGAGGMPDIASMFGGMMGGMGGMPGGMGGMGGMPGGMGGMGGMVSLFLFLRVVCARPRVPYTCPPHRLSVYRVDLTATCVNVALRRAEVHQHPHRLISCLPVLQY